jgi:lipopolysaccharide export system protein LptA
MLTARKLLLMVAVGSALWLARVGAQTPGAKPGGPVQSFHYKETTNGKVMDAIFTGIDSTPFAGGGIQVREFKMTGIRDGQATNVSVIAEAPECRIDYDRQIAGDPGPVQIYTPTTNLFTQARGFFCAESNQLLFFSNQVETRVLKSMLRSSPLFQSASNASPDAGEIVKIFSGRGQFSFHSNLMDYADQVRVIDPQYQLDAPLLSIQFSSNLAVETMFARTGVTITMPDKGVATGATAHYFATNDNVLLELDGDADSSAQWRNGEQQARAEMFTYDPNRHLLTGRGQVRVRWPNRSNAPPATLTFLELFAGDASLQLSAVGSQIERMTAAGDVILVNQADQSRATGGKADYDRPRDLFVLTEDPVWWNDSMEIRGETLSVVSSNKFYHAQGNARLKLLVSGAAGGPPAPSNQWLFVTADDIVSQPVNPQTNLITFRGNVLARLFDGEQLRDTLASEVLFACQLSASQAPGSPVVLLIARENVHAATAPDAAGVQKTLSCGVLTARRSPETSLWQTIVAEEDAVLKSFGSGGAAASNRLAAATITAYFSSATNRIESAVAEGAVVFDQTVPGKNGPGSGTESNHLTAALLTAHFSAVTNQVESAVAEGGVVFAQTAPDKSFDATADRAVYAVAPEEQVELTGHPWAQTDKLTILDADRLTYGVQSGARDTSGRYHIVFRKTNDTAAAAAPPAHPPP